MYVSKPLNDYSYLSKNLLYDSEDERELKSSKIIKSQDYPILDEFYEPKKEASASPNNVKTYAEVVKLDQCVSTVSKIGVINRLGVCKITFKINIAFLFLVLSI